MVDFIPVIVALLVAGVIAGFLAGLMGIGGGVVTIPALYTVFELLEYAPQWRMHMAVATSLAVIIATSIASVRAHHARQSVDWAIIKTWWLWLALGAILGAVFAKTLNTAELIYFFGGLIGLLALKMLLPLDDKRLADAPPKGVGGVIAPSGIGFFSAILGIGGGSFSVPYLTLFGVPIHRAVGTAAMGGMVISVAGGLSFLVAGLNVTGLPAGNLGFINLPAMMIVGVTSVIAAPLGAKVAHTLSRRFLSIVFGGFLMIAAIRLLTVL